MEIFGCCIGVVELMRAKGFSSVDYNLIGDGLKPVSQSEVLSLSRVGSRQEIAGL
jgi:hypothetical protein